MYKIEYKTTGGSVFASLHIDDREYHRDAMLFAERCNELEAKLRWLYENLPSECDSYLEAQYISSDINQKWITKQMAIDILTRKHFDYFVRNGELGYTMEGNKKLFDRYEVLRLEKQII